MHTRNIQKLRLATGASALLIIMLAAHRCDHPSHAHAPMDGHTHGQARLDMALEADGTLSAEFIIPGETLYGFEHRARTGPEKRKVQQALADLTRNFTRLMRFPSDANCAIAWQGPGLRENSGHGEVYAFLKAGCGNLSRGSRIRFELSRALPGLQKLVVRVITAGGTRVLTLEKGDGEITL